MSASTATRRVSQLASRGSLSEAARQRAKSAPGIGYRKAGQPQHSRGFTPPVAHGRRVAFPAKLRAGKTAYNGKSMYHLNGIASVVDLGYEMWDWFGPYTEIMDSAAFDKTLAASPDTAFLANHGGLTMARTLAMAGRQPTLLLGMVEGPEPTDNGLGVDAYVNPARTDVQDLVTAIDDGNVTQMSFAFMLIEGWWSDDFETFKITEVDIHRGDVSAVNYGANPFTSIEARQQEILADVRNMPASAARAAFRELMARNDLDLDTLMRAYEISETRAKAASRTQVVVVDTDDDDDEMDDDVLACPSCGAGNEADASFCDQCGASMDGAQMLAATPAGHSVRTASGMPEATGRSLLHIEALLAE